MKNRFSRLKSRYRRLRTRYSTFRANRRARRKARKSTKPKLFTMRWFKKNWLLLAIAAVAAYFFSSKFKAFADEKVLSKIKKPTA